jgi:hypothetical protein
MLSFDGFGEHSTSVAPDSHTLGVGSGAFGRGKALYSPFDRARLHE